MKNKTFVFLDILFLVLLGIAILLPFLFLNEREKKIMTIQWCFGEYEVGGLPIISSRYICK